MISLPATPEVSATWLRELQRLHDATRQRPPCDLADRLRALGIDTTARYAGLTIPHPFGKASGQLSHTLSQVEADVEAGVAFVVLKTVIAEDATAERTMEAWVTGDTLMRVEQRVAEDGRTGWTVTWNGRGWGGSLADYLEFFARSQLAAKARDVPVIPSVKYLLPGVGEDFRVAEYEHTTRQLLAVWDEVGCGGEMILEKDFSPTLAGDARAQSPERVLDWLRAVAGLIDAAAPGRVRIGVKLMNAVRDDRFQVEMMRTLIQESARAPDFLVVFNRLFDRERGIAYGGWDLSNRNLRVLEQAWREIDRLPPLSATGNICSGRLMVEYALCGCENGQLHTFFQLPLSAYTATGGSRSARALHTLLLHPSEGLAAWLRHLHESGYLGERDGQVRFLDLVERGREGKR